MLVFIHHRGRNPVTPFEQIGDVGVFHIDFDRFVRIVHHFTDRHIRLGGEQSDKRKMANQFAFIINHIQRIGGFGEFAFHT
ncbi:Uncharacterised protein [Vibrio cholerae]|nr:Uncharacterised protein [Vibrio cholerae]